MDIKQKIESTSLDLFMKYGVKSITMDEIARAASVSKKTIYQHFKDKNDLVLAITKKELESDKAFFESLLDTCNDAIEETFKIANHIRTHIAQMNPSLLFDLQKFHVNAWDYYNSHKEECFEYSVIKNIERGINEGNYRSNIQPKIIARMRMAQVESALSGDWFPQDEFNMLEVQMNIFDHFIFGLVTEQGLKLYNKYLSQTNE